MNADYTLHETSALCTCRDFYRAVSRYMQPPGGLQAAASYSVCFRKGSESRPQESDKIGAPEQLETALDMNNAVYPVYIY